jgi:hypothetical protein
MRVHRAPATARRPPPPRPRAGARSRDRVPRRLSREGRDKRLFNGPKAVPLRTRPGGRDSKPGYDEGATWVTATRTGRAVQPRTSGTRRGVDEDQITVRRTAEPLHLSSTVAGATLRAMARACDRDGLLVGGGQIGYRPTAQGRERLDAIERDFMAARS